MSLLAVPIIAVIALITSLLCLVIIVISLSRHKTKQAVYESQSQAQELLVNSLQVSNEKLTLLPLACSMLINNIYLAVGDILARIHHRLVSAVLFILPLLSSETLV